MTDKKEEKTVKRIVIHPNFHYRVNDVVQKVPVGTELTMTESDAERLKAKLSDPSQHEKVDIHGNTVEPDDEISALKKENASLKADSEAVKAENDALKKENASLKAGNQQQSNKSSKQ